MQLPIDADAATRLPAERDAALVTVFLPGSPERPRPNFASAVLPLDARGRLTITVGVRREAGIPNGADVLAVVDPGRRTVTHPRPYAALPALCPATPLGGNSAASIPPVSPKSRGNRRPTGAYMVSTLRPPLR
jgi:hypothetical protein